MCVGFLQHKTRCQFPRKVLELCLNITRIFTSVILCTFQWLRDFVNLSRCIERVVTSAWLLFLVNSVTRS